MGEHIQDIAKRLAALRELAGVSVEELCGSLSISRAEYERLESGETDIPVSVLWEAARFFGVDITELLTGNPAKLHTYSVTRKDRGGVEHTAGYDYKALAQGFAGRVVEPLLVTVPFEEDDMLPVHLHIHRGHEFHYCLSGHYTFHIGENETDIHEGDSLYFLSSKPHGMRAVGGEPALLLVVVIPEQKRGNDHDS